jgi:hypothetical protein
MQFHFVVLLLLTKNSKIVLTECSVNKNDAMLVLRLFELQKRFALLLFICSKKTGNNFFKGDKFAKCPLLMSVQQSC